MCLKSNNSSYAICLNYYLCNKLPIYICQTTIELESYLKHTLTYLLLHLNHSICLLQSLHWPCISCKFSSWLYDHKEMHAHVRDS